jgi:hypothetical protein
LGAVRGSEQILAILEDDEEPVIEVWMCGFAINSAILRQRWIGDGEQGSEIPQAVDRTLNAYLGNDGVFIMPADENFPRATGGGGEPRQTNRIPTYRCIE